MPASEDSYVPQDVDVIKIDPEFLRADHVRRSFHEKLKTEKKPISLIALAPTCFDNPAMLSGFIVWLLERNVMPIKIVQSGLLQHFFIYHYMTLSDEVEVEADNAFKKTYELLDLFSKTDKRVKNLVNLAKNTFCGMRGTKCNQPDSGQFVFLNLLNQDVRSKTTLPQFRLDLTSSVGVAFDAPYNLPELKFSSENAMILYDFFGFDFLCLLNCNALRDKTLFLQIKAHDPAGILDALCDRINSNEFQIKAFQKIIPIVADLFSSIGRDVFLTLVSKNPLFLLLGIYNLELLRVLPAAKVKKAVNALSVNQSLYSEAYLLIQLCLILKEISARYDSIFISTLKNTLFQKTLSSTDFDFDSIDALQVLSVEDLCVEKIKEWREKLTQMIEMGFDYQKLAALKNSFSTQIMLIEITYPHLLVNDKYLLDDYQIALKAFYIDACWNYQAKRHSFSLLKLLNECESGSTINHHKQQKKILLNVLRNSNHAGLLLMVIRYLAEHHHSTLRLAVPKIFFKAAVCFDVIKALFSALPVIRPPQSNVVNVMNFMRHPHHYSFYHICLAIKWIHLTLAPRNTKMNKIMKLLSDLLLDNTVLPVQMLVDSIQNNVNELHLHNGSLELKNALSNLLHHLKRGYVDFADLMAMPRNIKREREVSEVTIDDEPPARRAFSR